MNDIRTKKIDETELKNVTGGVEQDVNKKKYWCPNCKTYRFFVQGSGGRAYCTECEQEKMM